MSQQFPSGDAVLVQSQVTFFPMQGAWYTFWIALATTPPIRDSAAGIDYAYLSIGESIELNKGARLFPRCFSITYLGNGKVSICPAYKRNLTKKDIKIITVGNDPISP
jgi:hypothetical protein